MQDSIKYQITECQVNTNFCDDGTVIKLLEHVTMNNNLYLISESFDHSFLETLPKLIKNVTNNDLIAILFIRDLLGSMVKIYGQ